MTTRELAKDSRYGGSGERGSSVRSGWSVRSCGSGKSARSGGSGKTARSGGSGKSARSATSARSGASGGSGMSVITGSTMGARVDAGGQGGGSTMDFVPEYAFRQLDKDNASLRKQIRAMEGMAGKRKKNNWSQ